ncbi:helix-turn-helix domain-containing protein [Ligilactobacillus acidipiscis]|uniref:helix-turn-helix domain-containing protein n=1 Tax=Ligilactobacillus acidipiscis TaxID=89059 RepID=UPI0023F82246|nr:helix-turn-helix transcriptional regulator [Ligilactobacillus acidipiscis]WEV56174.1 helix-turn-helix transcriptional regulator [Ligilactobacillus acidipiscis]
MQDDTLGPAIKEIRKKRKFSQGKLASLTGFSRSLVSEHESGARNISKEHLLKYAQALDTVPQGIVDFAAKGDDQSVRIKKTVAVMQQLTPTRQGIVYNEAKKQFNKQYEP